MLKANRLLVLLLCMHCSSLFCQQQIKTLDRDKKDRVINIINGDVKGNNILAISDVHYDPDANSSDTISCCTEMWNTVLTKINSIIQDKSNGIRFIIFLGDACMHYLAKSGPCTGRVDATGVVKRNTEYVYSTLDSIAKKGNIPLILVPGNNDSQDKDYGAAYSNLLSQNNGYSNGLMNITYRDTLNSGCFSYKYADSLKIIVVNSNVFDLNYCPDKLGNREYVLKWFGDQLRDTGYRQALIAMHIPPGINGHEASITELWQRNADKDSFLNTIAKYQSKICGILSGHSHMDGYRLLEASPNSNIVSAILISVPAIAPQYGNNPGFKTISLDEQWQLKDFTTYYMPFHGKSDTIGNFNTTYKFSSYLSGYRQQGLLNYFQSSTDHSNPKSFRALYFVESLHGSIDPPNGSPNFANTTMVLY